MKNGKEGGDAQKWKFKSHTQNTIFETKIVYLNPAATFASLNQLYFRDEYRVSQQVSDLGWVD